MNRASARPDPAGAAPAISATGLCKSYGEHTVLDGIDLAVAPGTITALLGPNGAGKTTIVKILTTLISADAGSAEIAGHDVAAEGDAVRAAIGVTGQFSAVDEILTGADNLRLMADLHHLGRSEGSRRAAELLDLFSLTEAAGKAAATYSGGMRRRLDLAMSLMSDPRVLFLDEPSTGLDPHSRRDLWHVVQQLVDRGTTILLTTQYLDEADRLADRVAVLTGGRIVAEGTPDELKQRVPGGHLVLRFADSGALDRAAAAFGGAHGAEPVRNDQALTLQVPGDGGAASLRSVLDRLDRSGAELLDLSVHRPDLDDVFIALTGRSAATAAPAPAPKLKGHATR